MLSKPLRIRKLLLAVLALGLALLTLVAWQRHQLVLPGDVKGVAGRPITGCTVELLVRGHLADEWTWYVSREAVTNQEGAFSFAVFAFPGSSYRLRVAHQGYQEWLLEAPVSRAPRRIHITLVPKARSFSWPFTRPGFEA